MNWSSFTSGLILATCGLMALYLTLPPHEPYWRQCAPAQDGEAVVATSQYPDRTECSYAKKPTGRVIQRKRVTS